MYCNWLVVVFIGLDPKKAYVVQKLSLVCITGIAQYVVSLMQTV